MKTPHARTAIVALGVLAGCTPAQVSLPPLDASVSCDDSKAPPSPLSTARSTTIEWIPPSDPDLAGFKIYWGPAPGDYREVREVEVASRCRVGPLSPGRYYFSVTAYDTNRNESSFSNEISREIR